MPFVLNKEKVQAAGMAALKAAEAKKLSSGKAAFLMAVRAGKRQAEQLEVGVQVLAHLEKTILGPYRNVFRDDFSRALFFLVFRRIDVMTPNKERKFLELLRIYGRTLVLYLNQTRPPTTALVPFRTFLEGIVPPTHTDKIGGYVQCIVDELAVATQRPALLPQWRGILSAEMWDLLLPLIGSKPRSVKSFSRHFNPLETVEVVATLSVDDRITANLALAVQSGKLVDLTVREDTHVVDLTL
jgi:hypothetical protein